MTMTPTRFPRGLYGITPDWADTARLLDAIEQAFAGGMTALQWRRKTGLQRDRLAQARAVRALCRRLGLPLIINDDWRLALALEADGAHLGKDDGSIVQARAALGPDRLLGTSCYNDVDRARQHLEANVDYVAFGSVYPSRVKPDAAVATLADLRAGRQATEGPSPRAAVVAIGGIQPDNTAAVIDAGADSVAVISALFEAPDISAAARQFAASFT